MQNNIFVNLKKLLKSWKLYTSINYTRWFKHLKIFEEFLSYVVNINTSIIYSEHFMTKMISKIEIHFVKN